MGNDFDFGPAQAGLQKSDTLGDRAVVAGFLACLLKFLAELGERLGVEPSWLFLLPADDFRTLPLASTSFPSSLATEPSMVGEMQMVPYSQA
jgi:hypothetical protein